MASRKPDVRPRVAQEIAELRAEIQRHNNLYYNHESKIADAEFDAKMARLAQLEGAYPEYSARDSPSKNVGASPSQNSRQIEHSRPVLSLNNAYSDDDVTAFLRRASGGNQKKRFVIESKIDGVHVVLTYLNGNLHSAATRGDGHVGEDITPNVLTIETVPPVLVGDVPGYLVIHGEVYFQKDDFKQLNANLEADGKKPSANARNAAAGTLRLSDREAVRERQLSFVAHGFDKTDALAGLSDSYSGLLNIIHGRWKFPVWATIIAESWDDVLKQVELTERLRDDHPFDIDGVVIKIDDLSSQAKLGATERAPRWAIACKFAAESATTTIRDIGVQVSRNGTLTPVAILEPIQIGGVTIERATLNNFDWLERIGVRIGDHVTLERAADVIPKIVEILGGETGDSTEPYPRPETCPVCGSPVSNVGARLRCTGALICPAQLVGSIQHFASRDGLNIEGLGPKLIERN